MKSELLVLIGIFSLDAILILSKILTVETAATFNLCIAVMIAAIGCMKLR